jgi:hypothetical protein
MKKIIAVTITGALVLTACGSSNNGAARKEYAKFCAFLKPTTEPATSPHEENPAAFTDPKVHKTERLKEIDNHRTLIAKAPAEIKDELRIILQVEIAKNKIFEKYNFDLVAMAKDPAIREEFSLVANDKSALAAHARTQAFVLKNCDFDTN